MFKNRKEKKKQKKNKIGKMHVWALVDMISKEWKDVNDKVIAEQKSQIEYLKAQFEEERNRYNDQTKAYNQHVFDSNLERIALNTLIAQLQSQLITLKNKLEEKDADH